MQAHNQSAAFHVTPARPMRGACDTVFSSWRVEGGGGAGHFMCAKATHAHRVGISGGLGGGGEGERGMLVV